MPDYSKGKIYKLVSNYTKKIYIGSTCQPLHQRKGGHKSAYNMYIQGKRHYQTSFDLIKWGDVDIVLLEKCNFHNKDELHRKEREYIEKYNCVNKHIPTRTQTEYREDYKERRRFLRKLNKDKTLLEKKEYMLITKKILKTQQEKKDKKKQYNIDNKDKISQQKRQYKENNIDKVKEYQKEYRETHKDKAKKYHEINKDKLNQQKRQRYQKKKLEKLNLP